LQDSLSEGHAVSQGMEQDEKNAGGRLQLLHEVSGAFRPGVLTALVGVSGAGKTTLMDVLAGRKTGAGPHCPDSPGSTPFYQYHYHILMSISLSQTNIHIKLGIFSCLCSYSCSFLNLSSSSSLSITVLSFQPGFLLMAC
jgi:energy-coupling factor transporter ATP-binding protein EcfA2